MVPHWEKFVADLSREKGDTAERFRIFDLELHPGILEMILSQLQSMEHLKKLVQSKFMP